VNEEFSDLVIARHLVLAGVLVGLMVLESVLPETRLLTGKSRLRHDGRNLGLALLNGILGALVLVPMLGLTSAWVAGKQIGLANWIGGGVLAWITVLLLFDMWMYVWHRLNHELPFLWRMHRVHHSDVAMDASTALRFHPVEILLSGIARMALMPMLGMSVAHLLVYELILLPVILVQHANVRSPHWLDRMVRTVVVTPWMHRVHHSQLREETNSNYGSVLSIWDRIFGSWCWRSDPEAIVFGLDSWRDDGSQSLTGMLRTPLDHDKREDG
jgi:sterol desaturase/sphingolipid hydroxylase (fatty acid hydroxylase superfamily)